MALRCGRTRKQAPSGVVTRLQAPYRGTEEARAHWSSMTRKFRELRTAVDQAKSFQQLLRKARVQPVFSFSRMAASTHRRLDRVEMQLSKLAFSTSRFTWNGVLCIPPPSMSTGF